MSTSEIVQVTNPALLFGLCFDLMFFGILTAQVYVYYISFPNDRIILKIALVWVYLAGVTQTGLVLLDFNALFMHILQDARRNSFTFVVPDHFSLTITALTGAVAIVIQSLYAQRIYLISKKRWLAIMIICMSLCQFASSIIGASCVRFEGALSATFQFSPENPASDATLCDIGFTLLWGPINVACDLTITVCMVTFLLKHRSKTTRHKTRQHIMKIVQIIIETGMATAVIMIVYTVLFIFWAHSSHTGINFFFSLPGLMMSKVYSNSMLVLLNNRATISSGRNAAESFEFIEVSARGLEGDIELRTRGRD